MDNQTKIIEKQTGVPKFICTEFNKKTKNFCLLIPVINEGKHVNDELERAFKNNVFNFVDIVICDGGSIDKSVEDDILKKYNVNTRLIKNDIGKQGAQLRIGIWWALERGYKGILTIDGNNKDSIEDVHKFIDKLEEGYDYIQGSRFIKGGKAINTPISRLIAVKLIHAPIISLTAKHRLTDTTNNFRAYSRRYLSNPKVAPLRDVFEGYELLAYLSTRASQLGYKVCEVPVTRKYPKNEKIPTKISKFSGNIDLLKILFYNLFKKYNI